MTRTRSLWLVLLAAALGAAIVGGSRFGQVFPIVAVDLEMQRSQALEAARGLAEEHDWGTEGFRRAASFGATDPQVQTFVEMEAGGAEAWDELVRWEGFQPYLWTVRAFQEGEPLESRVRFAPDGRAWGFDLTLPEDQPGAALEPGGARTIAEAGAARWGVDLEEWTPVSASQQLRPGGRVDHTFIYDRSESRFGEGRYRLRLVVGGERLTELRRYVDVPEAFTRRHAELRSTNEAIALASGVAAGVLYLVLGAGVGLFLLLRAGWVVWRAAAAAAAAVGVLVLAANLNQLPLTWMGYDTAVPVGSFRAQQLLIAAVGFLGSAGFLAIIFIAAESLSRRAFPSQPQLWRSWSRGAANSDPLLARAAAGYVFAGFFIAYVVGFYLLATRVFGWTLSAMPLVEPDLLATPLPWVSAVALSLFAATSEETMFRAIPIAGAALIGQRFGGRRWWIGGAVLLQALIFAAAHANYPQQPAYARVVELFLPAVAFGLVYLRLGLIPVIIAHFVYNLVWFSLPVFATAPGAALPTKLVLVGAGLTPLALFLLARRRWGARASLAPELLNAGWAPPRVEAAAPGGAVTAGYPAEAGAPAGTDEYPRDPGAYERRPRWSRPVFLWGAAALGLALWLAAGPLRDSGDPRLEITAEEAIEIAKAEVERRGAEAERWTVAPRVLSNVGDQHRFIWQTAGRETFDELLGTHLAPPRYQVRFLDFESPVAERAERWTVHVGPRGEVLRVLHRLPEARPGSQLEESDARTLAEDAATELLGLDPAGLSPIGAEQLQRPERRDWTFTFRLADDPLDRGESRVAVEVAGDGVGDAYRYIHTPEEWDRVQRALETRRTLFMIGAMGLLVLLFLAALVLAVVRWARERFSRRTFLTILGALSGLMILEAWNGWRSTVAEFSTAEPLTTQVGTNVALMVIGAVMAGAMIGLLAGLAHAWVPARSISSKRVLGIGGAAGALLAGLTAVAERLAPATGPSWPEYDAAVAYLPPLQLLLDEATAFLIVTTLALLVLGALGRLHSRRGRIAGVLGALGLGLALSAVDDSASLGLWLLGGVGVGALIYAAQRLAAFVHMAVVPPLLAVPVLLTLLGTLGLDPYPGARLGALLALPVVAGIAVAWSMKLLEGERNSG